MLIFGKETVLRLTALELPADITYTSQDLDYLLNKHRPALVVFDPIQGYFGNDDMGRAIDQNSTTAVRNILDHVALWAARYNCAVVLIQHTAKKDYADVLHRGAGSLDITNQARTRIDIFEDPVDGYRYAVPTKLSNADKSTARSVKYEILSDPSDPETGYCHIMEACTYSWGDYQKAVKQQAANAKRGELAQQIDYLGNKLIITLKDLITENPDELKLVLSYETVKEAQQIICGYAEVADPRRIREAIDALRDKFAQDTGYDITTTINPARQTMMLRMHGQLYHYDNDKVRGVSIRKMGPNEQQRIV